VAIKTKLSPLILSAVGLPAIIGLVAGIRIYLDRSQELVVNDPAANAITVHLVLAALAIIAAVLALRWSKEHHKPPLFLAPFSRHAEARVKATLFFWRNFNLAGILRCLATLILLYLLLWEPFRAAMQIVAALDPNFTANAWGGPSYLGASLAHWLDGALIFYAAAGLLHLVMVKLPRRK